MAAHREDTFGSYTDKLQYHATLAKHYRAEPDGPVQAARKRMGKDEYCAVDSTSISTYGFHLVDIRWGHNKEHLPLKQTLEVIVYSLTSHMPIYYLELPGNMPDSRTIEMIVTELEHAGFKNVVLITDRGYDEKAGI